MGRESHIRLLVRPDAVELTGSAVLTATGQLHL